MSMHEWMAENELRGVVIGQSLFRATKVFVISYDSLNPEDED